MLTHGDTGNEENYSKREVNLIILTCGHTINSFDDNHHEVMVKGYTRELNKCIEYRTVCSECYEDYVEHNLVLETDELANHWLNKKGLE